MIDVVNRPYVNVAPVALTTLVGEMTHNVRESVAATGLHLASTAATRIEGYARSMVSLPLGSISSTFFKMLLFVGTVLIQLLLVMTPIRFLLVLVNLISMLFGIGVSAILAIGFAFEFVKRVSINAKGIEGFDFSTFAAALGQGNGRLGEHWIRPPMPSPRLLVATRG